MKIVSIFAPYLHAIQTNCINTYRDVLNDWNDAEYIYNFYKTNEALIKNNRFIKCKNHIEFTQLVIECASKLDEDLFQMASGNLNQLFEVLEINQPYMQELSKWKKKENLLRLYAIKIEENIFLITGGAIKITKTMQEHSGTYNELKKLEKFKNILIENGVHDLDSFYEYINS